MTGASIFLKKEIMFIVILLVGVMNVFLFVMMIDAGIHLMSPPNSPGDTEVLLGVMTCGASFLIFIALVIFLAVFYTRMKQEHLRLVMALDIIFCIVFLVGNAVLRLF